MAISFNHWITHPKPSSQAMQLFCLPYAGGSSSIFRTWPDCLPPHVEVCPVELPGRGSRWMEAPFTELLPLARLIAQALQPRLEKPFAFFGHSMGGLVSFELTRLLRQEYGLNPVHLFISGRGAPQISNSGPPVHALPEPDFLVELRRLKGTPEAVLENAELMRLLLPILRADFAVTETYAYTPEPPLECPITVLGGLQDREVSRDRLEAWREETTGAFSLRMLPGDHFFLHSAQPLLLQVLAQDLCGKH